jgi:pyruvate/2-oxoglutarate dehydrogenase complex dihydrolipoamide dehydrogenase (E3) component
MAVHECDVLVVGYGQAAGVLTDGLVAAGKRVIVAERKALGGSCVNFGCTPSKAVISSAKLLHQCRRADEFGLRIPFAEADFAVVLQKARDLVAYSVKSIEKSFQGDNPRLIRGHARFTGREGERYRLQVGHDEVRSGAVVLDTGTRNFYPDIKGLSEVGCLDASNWLHRDEMPRRLAIIGGGYISVEMSQFYRRMGSEVTVIEAGPRILAHEDAEVTEAIQRCLEEEGIRFLLGTTFEHVERVNGELHLGCGPESVVADQILCAVGRKPNTDDLGLETVGVKLDDKGNVQVDERLRTTAEGVYAVGDIRGGLMFTHTAWDDGRVVLTDLLGGHRPTTDRIVPYAVFTDPELGRVGLSEGQAKEAGKDFAVASFDIAHNGLAQERRETEGFVKVLVEKDTQQILGAAVLAAEGAEMVHLFAMMMVAKLPVSTLRDMVVAHPTWSEAVQNAVLDL